MKLFTSFTLPALALAFMMVGGPPVLAQTQNDIDQEYENFYDPFYDPYFDTNGGYNDDDILTDRELRAEIMQDLEMSPFVDERNIRVSVDRNIATLSGTVEDRSAMIDAVEIAYDAGAMRVRNELNQQRRMDERPWAEMRDRELKAAIEDELWWSPFVNDERIRVDVQDGVAVLHGTVENKDEIADAVENAYDAGAKRVRSRLWVNPDLS